MSEPTRWIDGSPDRAVTFARHDWRPEYGLRAHEALDEKCPATDIKSGVEKQGYRRGAAPDTATDQQEESCR